MLKRIYLEEYNSYVYINELEVMAIINGRIYLKNGNSIKLEVSKPLYDINQPISPVYVPIRYTYPNQTVIPIYSPNYYNQFDYVPFRYTYPDQMTIPIYSPYYHNQFDKSGFNPYLFPTITVSK